MEHIDVNSSDSLDNTPKICHQNNNLLNIYHQNICGLKDKTNEIVSSLYPLYLDHSVLHHTYLEHYNLGAGYCRQTLRQGGVCTFVHDTINYLNVN
jgi:hypothetical protein